MHRQTILGKVPSKSNQYRINCQGKRGYLYKSSELKQYEQSFKAQCKEYKNANIQGYFTIYIDVYYPSKRADLDNAMKCVLDCLQACNAFPNDNKCCGISAARYVDKELPRIEFSLFEV
jgi:Holliday junction resolvase RusA-like endonuclease